MSLSRSKPEWRRYLRPPPPTPKDVRLFTWGTSILGVIFFALIWTAFRWQDRQRTTIEVPRAAIVDTAAP